MAGLRIDRRSAVFCTTMFAKIGRDDISPPAILGAGRMPGAGFYGCTECGWTVRLDDEDDRLPACRHCTARTDAGYVRWQQPGLPADGDAGRADG